MIYLFSYELPFDSPRNTEPLLNEIRTFPGWAQCFDKTWLIATPDNITVVSQRLRQHLTDNDSWLIIPIAGMEYYGWLPQEIWNWINSVRNSGY